MALERRLTGGQELDVVGSEDGQLVLGHADDPVDRAEDNGDGASPVPLARHQPVTEAVVDGAEADPLLLDPGDGPLLGGTDVQAR